MTTNENHMCDTNYIIIILRIVIIFIIHVLNAPMILGTYKMSAAKNSF